mgnify:CR=1 FL=1
MVIIYATREVLVTEDNFHNTKPKAAANNNEKASE